METLKSSINVNMYIEYILGQIYINSITRNKDIDENILNTYINLLRQFLSGAIKMGFINDNNFEIVKEKFEQIGYFEIIDDECFGGHGKVDLNDNHIMFKDSNMKNEIDRIIFAFHEFFHALVRLSLSLNVIDGLKIGNLNSILHYDPLKLPTEFKVSCGFEYVIDDCMAQEVAELLAYNYLEMNRPKDSSGNFNAVLGDVEFKSNWSDDCYYRVFQESFRNIMGNNIDLFIKNCFSGTFNEDFFRNCSTLDKKILLLMLFENWFYLLSSIYCYIDPNNCFKVNEESICYSKDYLKDAYEIISEVSKEFKTLSLSK